MNEARDAYHCGIYIVTLGAIKSCWQNAVANGAANALQWRHNWHYGVWNHQPHDCLLNHLFRCRSKKASKPRVTGLCEGNSPVTGEFPAQRASNKENISIWWRHHGIRHCDMILCTGWTVRKRQCGNCRPKQAELCRLWRIYRHIHVPVHAHKAIGKLQSIELLRSGNIQYLSDGRWRQGQASTSVNAVGQVIFCRLWIFTQHVGCHESSIEDGKHAQSKINFPSSFRLHYSRNMQWLCMPWYSLVEEARCQNTATPLSYKISSYVNYATSTLLKYDAFHGKMICIFTCFKCASYIQSRISKNNYLPDEPTSVCLDLGLKSDMPNYIQSDVYEILHKRIYEMYIHTFIRQRWKYSLFFNAFAWFWSVSLLGIYLHIQAIPTTINY